MQWQRKTRIVFIGTRITGERSGHGTAPAARPALLVLTGAACLSVSAILVKAAAADPTTLAFLRCAIAVVFLIPLAWWEKRKNGRLPTRGIVVSVVAGVALGGDYLMWTRSIFDAGAGLATVLINVQVVVLPVLAWIVDRDAPPLRFAIAAR